MKFKKLIKSNLPNLRLIRRTRKNGIKICLGPDNYSYKMFFSSFKSKLDLSLKDDLKNIDYFIDIGSNIGWYSLCAAKSINCNCISVEPNPNTFVTLLHNIKINNLSQKIIPLNSGICTKFSNVSITNKSSSDQNNLEFIDSDGFQILPLRLDDLILRVPKDKIIAIKIDVEGLEEDVIISGKDSFMNRKEIKLIYIEILNKNILNVDKILIDFGFKCIKTSPNLKSECVNSIYKKF